MQEQQPLLILTILLNVMQMRSGVGLLLQHGRLGRSKAKPNIQGTFIVGLDCIQPNLR
jgi:hypothetical protein